MRSSTCGVTTEMSNELVPGINRAGCLLRESEVSNARIWICWMLHSFIQCSFFPLRIQNIPNKSTVDPSYRPDNFIGYYSLLSNGLEATQLIAPAMTAYNTASTAHSLRLGPSSCAIQARSLLRLGLRLTLGRRTSVGISSKLLQNSQAALQNLRLPS